MEKIEIRPGYNDLAAIRQIFQEYTDSLQVDLGFQHYDEELQNLEQKYGMPQGRIYAAYVEGALAGCMAFHALGDTSCELKRLYVRPAFRGRGLSRKLMERAFADAREIGYKEAYLDTLESLQSAVALYAHLGFEEIPAYYPNPLPGVLYYKKKLC